MVIRDGRLKNLEKIRNRNITFGRINVEAFVCIYTDFRTRADPMVVLNFVLYLYIMVIQNGRR